MRSFFLLLLLTISMYSDSIRDSIVKDISISTDGKIFKSVSDLEDFNKKIFSVKFTFNTSLLKDENMYLKILMSRKYLTSSSLKYELVDNYPIYKISKETPKVLLISANYHNDMPLFQLNIYNDFEYKYLLPNEKLLYGITYGIMFCALLYNLAFYYFNRRKSFLYYSGLQFFSITMLLLVSSISFNLILSPLHEYINVFNSCVNIIIMFSILFSIEFLNTKKLIPLMHKVLLLLLLLTFLDLVVLLFTTSTILYHFIPTYVPLVLLVLASVLTIKKGNKAALFYLFGWMILLICVFMVDTDYFEMNEIYLLHFAFPAEALIFSFALGYKINLIGIAKQKSEQLLIHQSKLASMGEMIANIAHQWRQPLTHLSYASMNLKVAYEQDKLTPIYFDKKTKEINNQIEFMSNTINDFSNFFATDKQIEYFNLSDCFNSTYSLLDGTFKHYGIVVNKQFEKEIFIESYKNEFSQVIFNLLNNAKEEFINKNIKEPQINVKISQSKNEIILSLSDNALGIDKNILDKIFEPYFTTKETGMGIGLYMSKVIIEQHMNGRLEAKNTQNGVVFTIYLPKA